MDKYLIRATRGLHDFEARVADNALRSLACVFKEIDDEVMTKSEIIELIDQYRDILKEELNINRP